MSLTKITSEGIADGSIVNADLHSNAAIAHSKLANSGVTAGSYGSATAIPALTINAQGLVTAASTNTVNTTTNLGISTATDSVTVTSSTGNNAQISEASGSAAGVMSVAHHDKLDGIEASATADQTASEILTLIKTVDGAGSGLDADTLDGISSASFVRSDADDTLNGVYTISDSDNEKLILSGSDQPFIRWQEGTTDKAYIQWQHTSGEFLIINQESGEQIRLGSGSNGLKFKEGGTEYTVFHSGNDGAGSGLDSDTVDGIQASSFLRSDADDSFSGTITANSDATNPIIKVQGAGPNFIQFASDSSGTVDADSINFVYRSSPNTLGFERASDATILFTVDADNAQALFSGNLDVGAGLDVTGNISVTGTVDGRDVASDGSKLDGIESGATADQSASEILTLIKTVDGSGSGLDADLLDGNGSSHYLNYNNLSNRPTIPSNNNQLSNGAGYMSGSSSQLAKAFVNYNGNNNSIRNDYNVSSISDHGNGDQTVNFSSSISMSYTVCGMPIAHDTGGTRCTNAIRGSSSSGPTRMNSTGVRINRGFGSHNAFQDGHTMCVAIFRP